MGWKPGQEVEVDQRGNLRLVGATASASELARLTTIDNPANTVWHDYVIFAQGNRMVHTIDGVVTTRLTDHDPQAPRSGTFGFQIYKVADA